MNYYKIKCKRSYAIMNEAPPKIDTDVLYTIVGKSDYYAHCVIVKRVDGKEFFGNNTWIVPENAIELIDI